ncbi:MAG TPA: nuclear transport factor 2 family protein [Chthoniobacterales bacterium]|nr:nuclear transport factor 2 family protein [Chthoniobacterales bacterium]
MKKLMSYSVVALFATMAISIASTPDKAVMEAREKSAWQAFKEKNADAFKKVVDKDIRCVYANRLSSSLQNELADMQKWNMKSFEFSDFDMFSDEKDVIVTTYKVKVDGTADGKDMSGTYNAGSVWKLENGQWLAIFHTNIKQETGTPPAG